MPDKYFDTYMQSIGLKLPTKAKSFLPSTILFNNQVYFKRIYGQILYAVDQRSASRGLSGMMPDQFKHKKCMYF